MNNKINGILLDVAIGLTVLAIILTFLFNSTTN